MKEIDALGWAVNALNKIKSKNIFDAKTEFYNCTDEQMQSIYKKTGKTRQQLLDEMIDHDKKVEEAISILIKMAENMK